MIRIKRTQEKDGFVWYEATDGRDNNLLHYNINDLIKMMSVIWRVKTDLFNFNLN